MAGPLAPPFFLDTNVPMYAAGGLHPYRDACRWIMTEIANGGLVAAIDTEVVQEVLHRYGSLGRFAEAATMATDLMTLISTVYAVTAADVQNAVALFQTYAPQGARARDVIHAAVMLNNGLTEIISTDTDFDLIPAIVRIDPLTLYHPPGPHQP